MPYSRTLLFINSVYSSATAKSLQSCPTLCNPMDGSPPGPAVPGSLQARKLEWVAISFSNAWKWKVKVKLLSPVRLLATPWTAAYQAPPSMGFSRQEDWSGVPLPSPIYSTMYLLTSQVASLALSAPFPFGNHKFVFYVCESAVDLYIISFLLFLKFHTSAPSEQSVGSMGLEERLHFPLHHLGWCWHVSTWDMTAHSVFPLGSYTLLQ